MAIAVFRMGKQMLGQPAYQWLLGKSSLRLQQFDTLQYPTVLVLPTATGRQQLFQGKRTAAYFVLIPHQSAKVTQ